MYIKEQLAPKFLHKSFLMVHPINFSYDQGELMDVDHISHYSWSNKRKCKQRIPDALFEQRKNSGAYFKCGSQEHWGSKYPQDKPWIYTATRTNGQKPQTNPNKPKNPQSKKCFNPQQMRQHIWTLIEENFAEGTEEYKEFIKEVEEQSF